MWFEKQARDWILRKTIRRIAMVQKFLQSPSDKKELAEYYEKLGKALADGFIAFETRECHDTSVMDEVKFNGMDEGDVVIYAWIDTEMSTNEVTIWRGLIGSKNPAVPVTIGSSIISEERILDALLVALQAVPAEKWPRNLSDMINQAPGLSEAQLHNLFRKWITMNPFTMLTLCAHSKTIIDCAAKERQRSP